MVTIIRSGYRLCCSITTSPASPLAPIYNSATDALVQSQCIDCNSTAGQKFVTSEKESKEASPGWMESSVKLPRKTRVTRVSWLEALKDWDCWAERKIPRKQMCALMEIFNVSLLREKRLPGWGLSAPWTNASSSFYNRTSLIMYLLSVSRCWKGDG